MNPYGMGIPGEGWRGQGSESRRGMNFHPQYVVGGPRPGGFQQTQLADPMARHPLPHHNTATFLPPNSDNTAPRSQGVYASERFLGTPQAYDHPSMAAPRVDEVNQFAVGQYQRSQLGEDEGHGHTPARAQGPWNHPYGWNPLVLEVHTSNIAQSTTVSVYGGRPAARQVPGGVPNGCHPPTVQGPNAATKAQPISIPKAVVDRANRAARGFAKVFEMVEQFAVSHMAQAPEQGAGHRDQLPSFQNVGVQPNHADGRRGPDPVWIKERIIGEAPAEQAAFSMMEYFEGRTFLTARVLARFVVGQILRKTCFDSVNNHHSQAVTTASAQIYQNIPPSVKHSLLQVISNNLQQLRGQTRFPDGTTRTRTLQDLQQEKWFNDLARARGNTFWPIPLALMPSKQTRDWDDLFFLMQRAQFLVFEIYTGAYDYRFDWLEGIQHFDPARMVARMNEMDRFNEYWTNEELVAQGARVSFVIFPEIDQRTFRSDGTLDTKMIVKAQVMVAF